MNDATARDSLAGELLSVLAVASNLPERAQVRLLGQDMRPLAEKCATAILAAGWRPPARVVTTVEELDALVAHTVVRYCTRYGWGTAEKAARDRWWPVGDAAYITNTQVLHYGPATVLWEPEEGE